MNAHRYVGHYFKKFKVPDDFVAAWLQEHEEAESNMAQWYFLNRLDSVAAIDGVVAWEDLLSSQDLVDAFAAMNATASKEHQKH